MTLVLPTDCFIFYWILHQMSHNPQNCWRWLFSALSSSGHSGRSFWCHSVICGRDVGPAHVVTCPDCRWHLQPGLLRQPPQRGCHRLVRHRGGAPWRRLQIPLWSLSLKGQNSNDQNGDFLELRGIVQWHQLLQTQHQCLPLNLISDFFLKRKNNKKYDLCLQIRCRDLLVLGLRLWPLL